MYNVKSCMVEISIKTELPVHKQEHRAVMIIEVPLQLNYASYEEAKTCAIGLALQEFHRRLEKCKDTRLLLKELGIEDLTPSDFHVSDAILLEN